MKTLYMALAALCINACSAYSAYHQKIELPDGRPGYLVICHGLHPDPGWPDCLAHAREICGVGRLEVIGRRIHESTSFVPRHGASILNAHEIRYRDRHMTVRCPLPENPVHLITTHRAGGGPP